MLAQPDRLIDEVVVAGVSGGRTSDEKVPRAWIVLSKSGRREGATRTIKVLEEWSQRNLTKQKWLRGGFEVVAEVCVPLFLVVNGTWRLTVNPDFQIPKSPMGKVLRRHLQEAYEQTRKTKTPAGRSKL